MEERERGRYRLYSVAQMKLDFMDGISGIDDVAIEDGLNLSVMYEPSNDNVIVSFPYGAGRKRGRTFHR